MTARARWLEGPPAEWDALVHEDPNATPVHRAEVMRVFADALPGCRGAFVAVEEEGALIGGGPLVLERRFGLEWMRAMPYTLPGAPLARHGRHADVDRVVAEALETKARESGVIGGEWVLFRPAGPAVDASAVERLPGETLVTTTEIVDLSAGAAAAYARIGRRERESIASARARGLACAEEPEALDETYALYVAQARAWRGHRPKPLPLLRRLLAGDLPAARLFTVRDSRGLLAGALALVGEREWLVWWSGSHPEARRKQAFASLLWSVGESAARAGAWRMNVGGDAGRGGIAAFKKSLGAAPLPVPIRWLGSDHASWWGRVVASVQRRMRAGRWRGAPA